MLVFSGVLKRVSATACKHTLSAYLGDDVVGVSGVGVAAACDLVSRSRRLVFGPVGVGHEASLRRMDLVSGVPFAGSPTAKFTPNRNKTSPETPPL